MDRGPIFIGGLAGSGKTLMRLMLSSHPNIAMSRRTYMWTRFYNRYGDLSRPDHFERCLTAMLAHKSIQVLKPDPERIRREFWQGPATYARLFALFHTHYAEQMGKPRWGDQLGLVERFAGPIFAAFPAAKMIHMIRDPRDGYEISTTRSRHRPGKVGWATARWLYSASLMKRNQRQYPDRYKVVRYETLVSQPEETLREVCAFLDEEFMPAMLTLENAIRFGDEEDHHPDGLPESHATVTTPDKGASNVMSKREIAFTQRYAGRDMLALGYPLEPTPLSLRDRAWFYLVDWPANWAGMVAWHTLEARQLA
jgi:hypothetical protein